MGTAMPVRQRGGASRRRGGDPNRDDSGASPRRSGGLLLAGLVGAVVLLAVVCLLSIAVGSRTIPASTTWQVLWHDDGSDQANIIHTLRIPRTLLGVLVGVALGLSGVVMQALTLNPLADPGLLGSTWGQPPRS